MTARHRHGQVATRRRLSPRRVATYAVVALILGMFTACGKSSVTVTSPPQLPNDEANATIEPIALRIPSIGVDAHGAPWVPLGLDDKEQIKTPDVSKPSQLGWYCPMATSEDPNPVNCGAPEPGRVGSSVILGHINGNGQAGVFAKLSKIKKGDTVEIDRADGKTDVFTIDKLQVIDKTAFPTESVYNDVSDPEIRLISCGGRLNKQEHRYLDQILAFGHLTDEYATKQ